MNYEAIIQRASEIATQRMRSGERVMPDDTVCVLCSASGRLFTGLSHLTNQGGMVQNVHAEVEAIRNMQVMGESVIQSMLLISIVNGMPLLPCFDCMRQILALHTDNIQCEIMMQDRAVPLSEFTEQLRAQVMRSSLPNMSVQRVTSISAPAPASTEAHNEASLIKDRVNSLLSVVEDDEEEENGSAEPEKKKRFGFFRKK